MPFFSKKSSTSTELIFDIESDSVCAAIVLYRADKIPRIIYHSETEVLHKANIDGAYLFRNMLKAVEEASQKASAAMHGLLENKTINHSQVAKIHVVMSSPWIISNLSCVMKKFETETVVRRRDAADMLEKERASMSKLFAVGDSAAIDAKLFEIKINGYPVSNFEGKRAKTMEGTMVVSFASRKVLDDIKSRINKSFMAPTEFFHSALILRYVSLRSAVPQHTDYIWLQIHGELTDVLVVRQGTCTVSGSLPFGSNTLVRRFAAASNNSESSAASSIALLANGSKTEKSIQETESKLADIMSEWLDGITNIASGGTGSYMPAVAYISAGNFSFEFGLALKKFSDGISIIQVGSMMMNRFVEYDQSVQGDLSASLYAAALPLSQKL